MSAVALFNYAVGLIFVIIILYKTIRAIRLVPNRYAYIVERLGKYHSTLGPGFHALIPFLDRVAFIRDLKEEAIPVPPQECFTKDEVQVEVDAVIYLSVHDAVNACYGVTDYRFASIQLAQTTTRSIIGTLDLDQTFEERDLISKKVVEVMDEVSEAWGIRVHRYEVKNIVPPESVKTAMEKQVTAERNRQARIAQAEGDRESRINKSEGVKLEMINVSEGEMQKRINEATGHAGEIRQLAEATSKSISQIAEAISEPGGDKAVSLRLSQDYLERVGELGKDQTQVLIPADLTRIDDLLNSLGLKIEGK